jgi:hypothetical protein
LADEAGTRTITSSQPGRSPSAAAREHVRKRSSAAVAPPSSRTAAAVAIPSSIEPAAPPDHEGRTGVQDHDVAVRTVVAVQDPPGQSGVGGRVPAAQVHRLGER